MSHRLISCFFILSFFLVTSCKEERALAPSQDVATLQKTAIWHDLKTAPCPLAKDHFMFQGAQEIGVRVFSGLHTAQNSVHTNEFMKAISPIYDNGFVPTNIINDLINENFSDSCLKVQFIDNLNWVKPENIEALPHKIFLDLSLNFVEGHLIENFGESDALFISGRLRRFLPKQIDAPAPNLNMEEPDNVVNYDIHLYPRLIIITKNMSDEELLSALKHEILLQLDFYIARTLFSKPIWEENHILSSTAYARYGHPEKVDKPTPDDSLETEESGD